MSEDSKSSSAEQFGNDSEPESIYEKLLPDCDLGEEASSGRSEEPAFLFCVLCLRECTPDVLVRFSSQPKPNHMDAIESQRKLEQLLGLAVALDDDGVVCRSCWKLVDIIDEFRESCLASACYIERFSRRVPNDIDIDDWLSSDVFNSMDAVQKAIRNNRNRIELEQVETEVLMNGFSEDVDVSDNESEAPLLEDRKKAVEEIETEVLMNGFGKDVDVLNNESHKVTNPPQRKVANKGRKKPTVIMEPEVIDLDDSSEGVDDSGNESPKPNNPAVTLLGDDNYNPIILTCEKCGRKFDGKQAHLMHEERCDNSKSTNYHTCTICNASFKETRGLRYHMNKHNGIRPFKCRKFCDHTFSSHYVRMRHENSICQMDGRICTTCGHKLKNESSLKSHMKRVHGKAKYVCATCSMAFRIGSQLRIHQRVHSDERKYPCKVCEKAFKSPYALKVHTRIHTQENPFACHICDQAFNYKVCLKAHIERHHGQMG